MNELGPYTFGCMSLGRDPAFPEKDLAVVRRAMDAGVWFHASPTYNNGFTFMVLRLAFDADRARVPRMILKVRDGSASLMRFETEDSCRRLGLGHIDIAQLVAMRREPGNLIDQLRAGGGPLVDELASLRARGLIRRAVLFLDRDNADDAVDAAAHPLIDGVTLYWNALQRDCTDTAWAKIRERRIPVLALRTLGGGASDPKLSEVRKTLATLFPNVGSAELALRLAASEPLVKTSIGGTASLAHLEEFLAAAQAPQPLGEDEIHAIGELRNTER
jgi:aryl-alcohol dehydrogenase-like predicted oxidoreductase